jgi:hypothetical protein
MSAHRNGWISLATATAHSASRDVGWAEQPSLRVCPEGKPDSIFPDHAPGATGEGMIVTDGGRFGGYGLYLLKGKPVFTYNFLGMERFRWEGQAPSLWASILSILTSSTMDPEWPRAVPVY